MNRGVYDRTWTLPDLIARYPLAVMPWVLTLSVAILVLRLRAPRPRWRRLVRQPGFVACGMVTAWLIIMLVSGLVGAPDARRWIQPGFGLDLVGSTSVAGVLILGAWTLLYVGGFWRPEKSRLDRAGRILGASWIALVLVLYLLRDLGRQ